MVRPGPMGSVLYFAPGFAGFFIIGLPPGRIGFPDFGLGVGSFVGRFGVITGFLYIAITSSSDSVELLDR